MTTVKTKLILSAIFLVAFILLKLLPSTLLYILIIVSGLITGLNYCYHKFNFDVKSSFSFLGELFALMFVVGSFTIIIFFMKLII